MRRWVTWFYCREGARPGEAEQEAQPAREGASHEGGGSNECRRPTGQWARRREGGGEAVHGRAGLAGGERYVFEEAMEFLILPDGHLTRYDPASLIDRA